MPKKQIKSSDIKYLVDAHHQVIKSGKFNFEECRIPVNNKLNINYLRNNLGDYKDKQICDLLEFGFSIGY